MKSKISYIITLAVLLVALSSCGSYNKELKLLDSEYKYEAAKEYYFKGQYRRAQTLSGDVLSFMKGSLYGEESLFLYGLSTYGEGDYESASDVFRRYYRTYPRGKYVEQARYLCGRSLYEGTLDPRLDQQGTTIAIKEFQDFLDLYPNTNLKAATHEMLLLLQDKLVQKEYGAAKLYYNLGTYVGNSSTNGDGSNYQACIVVCENALKDFPYASVERREEFSILLLRARLRLARESIELRKMERYRATVDEYYGFVNEYPESRYLTEAQKIFAYANRVIESGGGYEDDF